MKEIEVNTTNGTAFGYVVHSSKENIRNYLSEHIGEANLVANVLARKNCNVAILRNMYVDEDFRGEGQGNLLMADFLEEAGLHEAEFVMLICDKAEGQINDFSLEQFYAGFDFVTAVAHAHTPLMVDSEEIAVLIQKEIKKDREKSATLGM